MELGEVNFHLHIVLQDGLTWQLIGRQGSWLLCWRRCRNPVEFVQQLTISVIKKKFLDSDIRRSEEASLCNYRPSKRQSFTLLGGLSGLPNSQINGKKLNWQRRFNQVMGQVQLYRISVEGQHGVVPQQSGQLGQPLGSQQIVDF